MPKARETCTRCSMRRQKCDRDDPCQRCVAAGVGDQCTREWKDGYNPNVHRQYPRTRGKKSPEDHSHPSRKNSPNGVQAPAAPMSEGLGSLDGRDESDSSDTYTKRNIHEVAAELPSTAQMLTMMAYYEDNLSWYTWCMSIPQFKREFDQAFLAAGNIRPAVLDLRWVALLWSILCVSLTCADGETIRSWGLSTSKQALRQQWYRASLSCLYAARFMAHAHVNSLQTILTLSLCGHVLGHSSEIFTLFGVGIRLAQSLGYHRLRYDPAVDEEGSSSEHQERLLKREIARRIWQQLCIHDENSTVSTRMRLLHRSEYTTTPPRAFDIVFPDPLSPSSLGAHYASPSALTAHYAKSSWMKEVSGIIAESCVILNSADSEGDKFRQILVLDGRLRNLPVPDYTGAPWAHWGTQEAEIMRNNKIGFIHRFFFGKSFMDPTYKYSRWASIDAARGLIHDVDTACSNDPRRPIFWNDNVSIDEDLPCAELTLQQAHVIGACITLGLDNQNRRHDEPDYMENRRYLDRALEIFRKDKDSSLAANGLRVVSSLTKGQRSHGSEHPESEGLTWPVESTATVGSLFQTAAPADQGISSLSMPNALPTPLDDDIFADLSWMDVFGAEGFDNFMPTDNMFK